MFVFLSNICFYTNKQISWSHPMNPNVLCCLHGNLSSGLDQQCMRQQQFDMSLESILDNYEHLSEQLNTITLSEFPPKSELNELDFGSMENDLNQLSHKNLSAPMVIVTDHSNTQVRRSS